MAFVIKLLVLSFIFFFFNDTATTEIYTLSLHDALPICGRAAAVAARPVGATGHQPDLAARGAVHAAGDRKSTRLNSSHLVISYAVFCLKKKKQIMFVTLQVQSRHIHYTYVAIMPTFFNT